MKLPSSETALGVVVYSLLLVAALPLLAQLVVNNFAYAVAIACNIAVLLLCMGKSFGKHLGLRSEFWQTPLTLAEWIVLALVLFCINYLAFVPAVKRVGIRRQVYVIAGPETLRVAKGMLPDLAVDTDGKIHVAYYRDGDVFYRAVDVSPSGDVAAAKVRPEEQLGGFVGNPIRNDPEIAVGPEGTVHVFGGHYWRNSGSGWRQIGGIVAERDSAMAVDKEGNVYICKGGGNHGGYLGLLKLPADATEWQALPDPDIAAGFAPGKTDEVYAHLAVSPVDDSLHIVYLHGTPQPMAYRYSIDGGITWSGGGVMDDDVEAPALHVSTGGTVYAVSGSGNVVKRTSLPSTWESVGGLKRPLQTSRLELSALMSDRRGKLYVTAFDGRYCPFGPERWSEIKSLEHLAEAEVGFVQLARGGPNYVYAVYEAGQRVEDAWAPGTSEILLTTIKSDGNIAK